MTAKLIDDLDKDDWLREIRKEFDTSYREKPDEPDQRFAPEPCVETAANNATREELIQNTLSLHTICNEKQFWLEMMARKKRGAHICDKTLKKFRERMGMQNAEIEGLKEGNRQLKQDVDTLTDDVASKVIVSMTVSEDAA